MIPVDTVEPVPKRRRTVKEILATPLRVHRPLKNKVMILQHAAEFGTKSACRKFRIADPKTIRDWQGKADRIQAQAKKFGVFSVC